MSTIILIQEEKAVEALVEVEFVMRCAECGTDLDGELSDIQDGDRCSGGISVVNVQPCEKCSVIEDSWAMNR